MKNLEPGARYAAFYFDPATGRRFDQGVIESATGDYRTKEVPSPQDWVLVLEARTAEQTDPAAP